MSIRRRAVWCARDAMSGLLHVTGGFRLYRRLWGRKGGFLSYHNVLPADRLCLGYDTYRMDMPAEVFRRQIDYLVRQWKILPAEQIVDAPDEGFFLCFDDGMRNNYEVTLPILESYGLTAMFAVCPGLMDGEFPYVWKEHLYLILRDAVGRDLKLPFDDYAKPVFITGEAINSLLRRFMRWVIDTKVQDVYGMVGEMCDRNGIAPSACEADPLRFSTLTWEMAADMQTRGHVIASHTWSHRVLRVLSTRERTLELAQSRERMEERLVEPISCVVYPYGGTDEVDEECMMLAKKVGYQRGFMNVPCEIGSVVEMSIPRFGLSSTASRAHLQLEMSGLKDRLKGMK